MKLPRQGWRVEWVVALVALYAVVLGNVPWWRAVLAGRSATSPTTWLFFSACFVALVAAHFVLLVLPSTRWTVKPFLSVMVVATAATAYYMVRYGVLMDPTMLRNIVRTDARESREMITGSLLMSVALWSAAPLWFLWWVELEPRRPLWRSLGFRAVAIIAALSLTLLCLLAISRDLTSLMRNRRELRYLVTPGNLIVGLIQNAATDVHTAQRPKEVVGADARLGPRAVDRPRPVVFVLALGETARAANFSLLGYERVTNPELATFDLVAFRNVASCGTSTEVSLPCMFSPFGRADFNERRIRGSEGVLDVLRRAGYAVSWYDNQSGCKGVCGAPGITYRKLDGTFAPDLCDGSDCLDDILLRALDGELARVSTSTVIVLHLLGNHGPAYYRRYPPEFRRFTPDCQTAELRDCTRDEVVNAYDNAILYTDHVVAEMIRRLQARSDRFDTALLYLSDHGESLGEAGLYLHGIPYAFAPDVQTHVPMLSWMSPSFAATVGVDPVCLAGRRDAKLSHDNLFHSLLGVLDVETSAYRPERDLFASCRAR